MTVSPRALAALASRTLPALLTLAMIFCAYGVTSAPALAVEVRVEQDREQITVTHGGGGLVFPRRGGGGLPTAVIYPGSDHLDRGLEWKDLVFNAQRGGAYMVRDDVQATARVIHSDAHQVVVESRARFVSADKKPAPGHPTVTYRWIFRADSPAVVIQAQVQSRETIYWPELHLFWITWADETKPTRWVAKTRDIHTGEFIKPRGAHHFSDWAVIEQGNHAVGLSFDAYPVNLWDLASYHAIYMQYTDTLDRQTFTLSGRLYIGSRQTEEAYDALLAPSAAAAPAASPRGGEGIVLANDRLRLTFDRQTLACVQIEDPQSGHMFLQPTANGGPLWQLDAQDAQGRTFLVSSDTRADRRHEWSRERDELALHWDNLHVQGRPSGLSVTATVTLKADADRALWRFRVDNAGSYSLLTARYPMLPGLARLGHADAVVPRSNWGKIERNVIESRGHYPAADWPMQFVAVLDGPSGLYLAYEDPEAFEKQFLLQPGRRFYFSTPMPDATIPGNDYEMPGAAAIGVSGPDWLRAAKMYREWALKQPWASDGPIRESKSRSQAMRRAGLWINTSTQHSADFVVEQIRALRAYFDVPLAVQYYFWHHGPMDELFPDYFPARPDLDQVVAGLPEDVALVPYTNARIYDQAIDTWSEHQPGAVRTVGGDLYVETYGTPAQFVVMCPSTTIWQDVMVDVVRRLVHDHGVGGIYLDQVAAAPPIPCYHPDHGHALGGGGHWVEGYNRMLERLHAAVPEGEDVLFTTENNAEPYMKGLDGFLIWNPRHPDEVPIMTAVYSGYTTYFGSNAQCDNEPGSFAMIVGRDFLWGAQLGWMDFPQTTMHKEFLRRLVKLRYANLDYLLDGELVGELEPTQEVGVAVGKWNNLSFVDHSESTVELPAVMGSVWRGIDGSAALFAVNFTHEPKVFHYRFDPSAYGLDHLVSTKYRLVLVDGVSEPVTSDAAGPIIEGQITLEPYGARAIRVHSSEQ